MLRSQLFGQDVLIPSQKEKKRKKLEREKEEKEASEREEELEVYCDPTTSDGTCF